MSRSFVSSLRRTLHVQSTSRSRHARIVGWGMTPVGKLSQSPTQLMQKALEMALSKAKMSLHDLNGLIAIPSLAEPHFMEAHYLATQIGLLPHKDVLVRTIDTGGAGPVSGLLEATRLVETGQCTAVAVVAGDAVSSLSKEEFLKRADQGCQDPDESLPSPVIPNGYDRIAAWQMDTYGVTREQLAMCAVLMSRQAQRHPLAMTRTPHTLQRVLTSTPVGKVTNTLECARRADGGAAIIVASVDYLHHLGIFQPDQSVVMLGGGEASGPLFPPKVIDESMFSCEEACDRAYETAQLSPSDIDVFGLYDCFPVCLIRAIEAAGLTVKGNGGNYIQKWYETTSDPTFNDIRKFPINTHGGLLAFGAPWETPAMYNIIEVCNQLTHQAEEGGRQIHGARRGLVYGNGGIFSASSVALLGNGKYHANRSRDTLFKTQHFINSNIKQTNTTTSTATSSTSTTTINPHITRHLHTASASTTTPS